MKKNTILVTGGYGFIGMNLCEILLKEFNVIIVSNSFNTPVPGSGKTFWSKNCYLYDIAIKENSKLIEYDPINLLDANDIDSFIKYGFTYRQTINYMLEDIKINNITHCIHLAANSSIVQASDHSMDNIQIIINVLKLCKQLNIKNFINFSSSAVYGDGSFFDKFQNSRFFNVDSSTIPISSYGLSKLTIENLIKIDYKDMNIHTIRPFNVYGPWMEKGLIYNLLNNKDVKIFNNGNNIRDYVYVKDLCNLVNYLIHSKRKNLLINFASGFSYSAKQLIKIIEKHKDIDYSFVKDKLSTDAKICKYDKSSFSKESINIEKFNKTSLEAGIIKTIKWFNDK